MLHPKNIMSVKNVYVLILVLGISIFIYHGCNDTTIDNENSFDYDYNWCRVYTQDDLVKAINKYRSTYGEDDSDALAAMNMQDFGQIAVIEDDGTLYGSVDGVGKVIRKFYNAHPDNFDIIAVYSNFDIAGMDDAFAWHIDIQNQIRGIGMNTFDYSEAYGSSGRLKGFQLMNSIYRYGDDPDDIANMNNDAYEILGHETSHQWSFTFDFRDDDGRIRPDLKGHQGAHYSYNFDGDDDFLYGHMWQNNGNGTFSDLGACHKYGQLTLYAMGMIDASEVQPFLFIENASVDPIQYCFGPGTNTGTARTLTINHIIGAEGARDPGYANSQKNLRMAFILVTQQGKWPPTDRELQWLDSLRQVFPNRFSTWTRGRGTMDTNISTLAPPTGLQIVDVKMDQSFLDGMKIVKLAWDAYPNSQLSGFNIYHATSSEASFAKVNATPVSGTTMSVDGLEPNKTYCFHVTAVLSTNEESTFSEMVCE